jgi:hypothetical protein
MGYCPTSSLGKTLPENGLHLPRVDVTLKH